MSSLALKPEVSVTIPKLLLAAVQPYQTIAGPALTTNFLTHTSLFPFQKLPFTHSSVAPVYFHTLLHSLAEYCETPRPVRTSHVKQLHPPHENFWDDVGTLNCFYSTTYHPCNRKHPAMGAVELMHTSHRKESDVRLTLYDEAYQPLVAMIMTGPRGNKTPPLLPNHGSPAAPDRGSYSLRCRMLPRVPPPSEFEGYWHSNSEWCGIEGVSTGVGNPNSFGGLYGPLESLQGGGYAQRVCYCLSLKESTSGEESHHETQNVAGMPSEQANHTVSEKEDDAADSAAVAHHLPQPATGQPEQRQQIVEAPPWMLTATIRDLCERLHREGCLSPAEGRMSNLSESTTWCMAAYQGVQCGDIVFNESFDIVCAAPRVQPNYRVPPWRHQIGQPVAKGYGSCVVSLMVELRQFGEVVLSGTFYFQPDLPE